MQAVKIKDVTQYLETIAPPQYQEDYDNSGLLTGDANMEVKGILVTLDCLEDVVEEAIQLGFNLIVAHHPILFRGLKRITGKNYVERTIIKAVKNDIAIYAMHTNFDNVAMGVNSRIGERLGVKNSRILDPRPHSLHKLVTFVPESHATSLVDALHEAGAGNLGNYEKCSFRVMGEGTFLPRENARPHTGQPGQLEKVSEARVEMIYPAHLQSHIEKELKAHHPYEEVAYYITELINRNQEVGSGMIGELEAPEEPMKFLKRLKIAMKTGCVRHTPIINRPIKRVAWCGGAGSFLLQKAISAGADAFVSADFKYHEFFDADGKILIADIGHYESEQFTKELMVEDLKEKFTTFAINFSSSVSNPISYL